MEEKKVFLSVLGHRQNRSEKNSPHVEKEYFYEFLDIEKPVWKKSHYVESVVYFYQFSDTDKNGLEKNPS